MESGVFGVVWGVIGWGYGLASLVVKGAGNQTTCVLCGKRLVKNGKTAAGTQRWRCLDCGTSSVRKRPDVTRASQLREFVDWLLGSATQRDLDRRSGRYFRDQHAWCWRVAPLIPTTGEVFDEIQIDGTYLGNPKRCFLVAITASMKVIKWRWAKTETTESWTGMLEQLPPPKVVVTDGGTGIASALAKCWPETRIQRCLVHVQRDVLNRLTQNPRTEAAKSLRALAVELTSLKTQDAARDWEVKLHDWHQVYADFLNEKTIAAEGVVRPAWAGKNAAWWSPTSQCGPRISRWKPRCNVDICSLIWNPNSQT